MYDPFGARMTLDTSHGKISFYQIHSLQKADNISDISSLPYSIRILLEALLRNCDGQLITEEDVLTLARWNPEMSERMELAFMPARVLLQDFTGVPAIVDLAAMRSAMVRLGGNPERVNPLIPADLVVDHSVQVDRFGAVSTLLYNAEREFERNRERYEFLRWGQEAMDNFQVIPPSTGIVHQVNLEYLAKVVRTRTENDETIAFPDTVLGTDSHTTMINGLGVLGWGVGGIEAEATMLGQPYYMLIPEVVGCCLTGELREGLTATDLVLTVTQVLREKGVVGKFVEFYGPGVSQLSLPDRATIANMAPEYGATIGFFPVDDVTLDYLRYTGRPASLLELVDRYTKEQGLFRTDSSPEPRFTDNLEIDLSDVQTSLAGPKRPQDRIRLGDMKTSFQQILETPTSERGFALTETEQRRAAEVEHHGERFTLHHGSVVIAAITSCTNTSNPSVMLGAGLLAKNAVEHGLTVKPYVKTSLAPGSLVVTEYLRKAGLLPYLEALRFHVVGYGCTTCICNSGSLPEPVATAIEEADLVAAAVLSGNRNFEGRVNPHVKANYLASPPLVVAYALAGRVDIDLQKEPIGYDANGEPVYLSDIWPTQADIHDVIAKAMDPEIFRQQYGNVFDRNEQWNQIHRPEGDLYDWQPTSTYIQEPPFFVDMTPEPAPVEDIRHARVLALLGDSVTTDHISPAGAIPVESPAGRYLMEHGAEPHDFNSFGSRRGNHEVMMRGTFGNIRLKNLLLPDTEGGVTLHHPSGQVMSIYDAAMRYQEDETPLLVLAGKEYGTGSSRDWAAKGALLLGVKAVIAESYERIHRSNLIGMGILPLQFQSDENWRSLGLTGHETYDIVGVGHLRPGQQVTVHAKGERGVESSFTVTVRIDTSIEMEYYRNGGILQTVLRQMINDEISDHG